jgi:non-specific serine/threonine protein kinase
MSHDAGAAAPTYYRYRFGSAEFDEATFELRVSGLRVEVERRALEVLAYLLRHAGEVVTKEELFREVWAGRVTVDKVLPNAITKLRRALGEANAELLLTQPRVGYRLSGLVERVVVGRKLASQLALSPGEPVPGRENFVLKRQLGGGHGGEVWLAEHAKTHERRVYKFGVDGERLRALKREATLSRVLQEGLEDREHFVELIDWNFESAPFFLECEYGGESLYDWSREGLAPLATEERLGLFLQIADAVAAAHGVGVLHKDLKPANVLIASQEDGWRIRLTDFGSGRLLDPERLEELGITQFGLTATQSIGTDSSTGTPLYVAPEVFAGHAPTVQSDVYALGILLYQMLAGDLSRPMASGWEQDIGDELVREDIRLATDGNPARRLAGAGELAARLRGREARRAQAQRLREDEAQARIAREQLARNRARRPYLIALAAAVIAGLAVVLVLYREALDARDAARRELERSTAINRFLNEELIGRSNPVVVAQGANAPLKDVLMGARQRIAERFRSQPLVEASIRLSLAPVLNAVGFIAEAEDESRQALATYEREEGAASLDALKARSLRIAYLSRLSKFDAALDELTTLDRLAAGATDPAVTYLKTKARGLYHLSRGETREGVAQYRLAIPALEATEPDNFVTLDGMRVDLIHGLAELRELAQARREAQALLGEISARKGDYRLATINARHELARVTAFEGDLDTAEAQLLDVQKSVQALLGADHNTALRVLNDLSYVAQKRKDWPAALKYAELTYEGVRRKYGDDSNITNNALMTFGQFLYEGGRLDEAQARLATAHAKLVAKVSARNPDSQYAGFYLAAVEIELGKLDQAAALLDTLDEEALAAGQADSAARFRLDALRGLLLDRRRQPDAAAPLLRTAVEGMHKAGAGDERVYLKARQALDALGGGSSG